MSSSCLWDVIISIIQVMTPTPQQQAFRLNAPGRQILRKPAAGCTQPLLQA